MREIKISIEVQKKIKYLFEYLEENLSVNVRVKYAKKLYKTLNLIRTSPELFPKSQMNKKLHKCVVTKQTTLFYNFTNKQVNVVSIFDTRQNPTKIKTIK